MPDPVESHLQEILSRQQDQIDRVKEALALLGVAACSWCKRYFRRAEPGAMFDGGELVCYGCIPEWWPRRREKLSGKDRDDVEGKLVFWLRQFHRAESFKGPGQTSRRLRAGTKSRGHLPGVPRDRDVRGRRALPLLRGPRFSLDRRAAEIADLRPRIRTDRHGFIWGKIAFGAD